MVVNSLETDLVDFALFRFTNYPIIKDLESVRISDKCYGKVLKTMATSQFDLFSTGAVPHYENGELRSLSVNVCYQTWGLIVHLI